MGSLIDEAAEVVYQGGTLTERLDNMEWKVDRLETVMRRVMRHIGMTGESGAAQAVQVAAPVLATPALALVDPPTHQPAAPCPAALAFTTPTETAPSGAGPIESSTPRPTPSNDNPPANNAPSTPIDPPIVQLQPPTPQTTQEVLAGVARIIHPIRARSCSPLIGPAVAGPSRLAPPSPGLVTQSRSKSPVPSGLGNKRKAENAASHSAEKRRKSG